MKEPSTDELPEGFAEIFGLKKLTPEQEFGKALLELNKKYGKPPERPDTR